MTDRARKPRADRHQLQQIVAGLTEGVILFESDRKIVWANEAALDMHGVKSVGKLGTDVSQYRERFRLRYRNHHALQADQYPFERVLAGESLADVVVEVFSVKNDDVSWVHRIRSLVLTDPDGEPDCLALVIQDASDWADAEQRFEKAFNANPAPAVICRLADQRYIKVNQGFLELTGYQREQVIGESVYQLDVLENASSRELALERLGDGMTIPQMEAEVRLPGGARKPVMVAGQPIEIGDDPCMLFTFMDLEPRRVAEATLRQSEERFQKAFRMLPVPAVVLSGDDFVLLDVNDVFSIETGYAAQEVVGHAPKEVALWVDKFRATLDTLLAGTGQLRGADLCFKRKDGELIDCLVSAERVDIAGQSCVLMAWLDIGERKKTEVELVEAIETVMRDATWFSKTLVEKLANVRRRHESPLGGELIDLTRRERDVFDALCRGRSDKAIAKELGVALSTVRNHVNKIYTKLDVHSRGEVVLWARDHGHFVKSKK